MEFFFVHAQKPRVGKVGRNGARKWAQKRPPLWVVLLGYLVLDNELVNNPEAGSTYDEYPTDKIIVPNLT